MKLPKQWQEWVDATAGILRNQWGLESAFADDVAVFLAYLTAYDLRPGIKSGFRDPAHQKELQARWDAGDRAGLRVRPAADSLHSTTRWGHPAASAIDVSTTDDVQAAAIARALGLVAGIDFRDPDPGHYAKKGAKR